MWRTLKGVLKWTTSSLLRLPANCRDKWSGECGVWYGVSSLHIPHSSLRIETNPQQRIHLDIRQPKQIPFPLDDVEIRRVDEIRTVQNPVASNDWMSLNTSEFSMRVENVGSFYVRDGNFIEYSPHENTDAASLELYMNGSVYGAILHQRKILPLHGSSFVYNNSGVMFCGESGAGKSSLTTSFCLDGATFLTDDVSPILFDKQKPLIWPKTGKVKLWDDSLQQLKREKDNLTKIHPEDEKYYFPIESTQTEAFPLHQIFILQIDDVEIVSFETVKKAEAFSYLHQEIYRREFLMAMKQTEAAYLEQISSICNHVRITRVTRPAAISIEDMNRSVRKYMDRS